MDKAKYVDKQSFIADVETGLKDKIPVTATIMKFIYDRKCGTDMRGET